MNATQNSLIIIEFIWSCYLKIVNLLDEESSNAISSKGEKIQLYMHHALGCSLMITRGNERGDPIIQATLLMR